jgi:hypothetical protein
LRRLPMAGVMDFRLAVSHLYFDRLARIFQSE